MRNNIFEIIIEKLEKFSDIEIILFPSNKDMLSVSIPVNDQDKYIQQIFILFSDQDIDIQKYSVYTHSMDHSMERYFLEFEIIYFEN